MLQRLWKWPVPPQKAAEEIEIDFKKHSPKSTQDNFSKSTAQNPSKSYKMHKKSREFCASNTMIMVFLFLGVRGWAKATEERKIDWKKIFQNRSRNIFPKSIKENFPKSTAQNPSKSHNRQKKTKNRESFVLQRLWKCPVPPQKAAEEIEIDFKKHFPKSTQDNFSISTAQNSSKSYKMHKKSREFCASNTMIIAFFSWGSGGGQKRRKKNRLKEIFPKSIEEFFQNRSKKIFQNRLLKIHRKATTGKKTKKSREFCASKTMKMACVTPKNGRRNRNRLQETFSKIDPRQFLQIDCSKSIEKFFRHYDNKMHNKNARVLCFKHYDNGLFFLGVRGWAKATEERKIDWKKFFQNRSRNIFPKSIKAKFPKSTPQNPSKSHNRQKKQKIARVLCFKDYENGLCHPKKRQKK